MQSSRTNQAIPQALGHLAESSWQRGPMAAASGPGSRETPPRPLFRAGRVRCDPQCPERIVEVSLTYYQPFWYTYAIYDADLAPYEN